MVIVKISDGLGNQMFQYAAGYNLAKKLNTDLRLDITSISNIGHEVFMLGNFNISAKVNNNPLLRYLNYVERIFRTKLGIDFPVVGFIYRIGGIQLLKIESAFVYDERYSSFHGNIFLTGYFQNISYFENAMMELRNEFCIKSEILTEDSQNLLEEINANKNAVSIHVRRGDYAHHGFEMLSVDYYEQAIKLINEKIENPQYYLFGDGQKWFMENVEMKHPVRQVTHTNVLISYEDIILMSATQNNIISNSTFSWWGAFLNKNNPFVIAPRNWIFKSDKNINLFLKDWILL